MPLDLDAPGTEEGETCSRDGTCPGVLEMRPSDDLQGCSCHICPPCSYCMSIVPECPVCGWRAEEPS